jgi:hypothetical protein
VVCPLSLKRLGWTPLTNVLATACFPVPQEETLILRTRNQLRWFGKYRKVWLWHELTLLSSVELKYFQRIVPDIGRLARLAQALESRQASEHWVNSGGGLEQSLPSIHSSCFSRVMYSWFARVPIYTPSAVCLACAQPTDTTFPLLVLNGSKLRSPFTSRDCLSVYRHWVRVFIEAVYGGKITDCPRPSRISYP